MVRKIAILAALCALSVLGASSASAATFIHGGTTSGNVLAANTWMGSSTISANSTLTTGTGTITCSSAAMMGQVGASGGASVTGSLDFIQFGSTTANQCTGTGFAASVHDCVGPAVSGVTVTANTHTTSQSTGTLTIPAGYTVTCLDANMNTVCSFTVKAGGISATTTTNYSGGNVTSNSLVFSNASNLQGNGICIFAGAASFNLSFTNVRAGTSTSDTSGALLAVNTVA